MKIHSVGRILVLAALLATTAVASNQATLPSGQVGASYSYTFPTIGVLPDTFSSNGQLPPGLTLNPNTGVLSGTPTAPGPYTFTVTITDSFLQQQSVVGSESLRHTKGMANGNTYGPFSYTITIAPGVAGAPMSPAALALLMLGLAAAGIFRMRQVRQS